MTIKNFLNFDDEAKAYSTYTTVQQYRSYTVILFNTNQHEMHFDTMT